MSERQLTLLDKMRLTAMGKGQAFGNADDPMQKACPLLWAWLTSTDGGEDFLKEPATLTIRLIPGGVNVSLGDRSYGLSVETTCDSLSAAFAALERELASPTPLIKQWPKHTMDLKKRPKKKETSP